jgi:hypothetical protein
MRSFRRRNICLAGYTSKRQVSFLEAVHGVALVPGHSRERLIDHLHHQLNRWWCIEHRMYEQAVLELADSKHSSRSDQEQHVLIILLLLPSALDATIIQHGDKFNTSIIFCMALHNCQLVQRDMLDKRKWKAIRSSLATAVAVS